MLTEACIPHRTACFSALLMPLVAGFAVWVARQQSAPAKNKLRFDQFEKRFSIYEGAHKFLGKIMTRGKVDESEMQKFENATDATEWIVSREVADYLDREVYKPAMELQGLRDASERFAGARGGRIDGQTPCIFFRWASCCIHVKIPVVNFARAYIGCVVVFG